MNKYESRFFSVKSRFNGRIVAQVGLKRDTDGVEQEESDTREFATEAEAMKFVEDFFKE